MTKWHHNTLAITLIALAAGVAPSVFAEGHATGQLLLVIRPQVSLQSAGADTVRLQIRLAREATANIWTAQDSCSVPSPTARTISRSGSYDLSASELGSGNHVCLASSDGTLNTSIRVSNQSSAAFRQESNPVLREAFTPVSTELAHPEATVTQFSGNYRPRQ